jgi:hypothetical protein
MASSTIFLISMDLPPRRPPSEVTTNLEPAAAILQF